MATTLLIKRSGESRTYTTDFSRQPELTGGDKVVSVTSVVLTQEGNEEVAVTDLTVSSITVAAGQKAAQFVLAGGTSGTRYRVAVTVQTLNGATLEGVGYLLVDDYA